jgi:hypothetical protein
MDGARENASTGFDGDTPPGSGASDPEVPAEVSTAGAAEDGKNASGSTNASASVAGGR